MYGMYGLADGRRLQVASYSAVDLSDRLIILLYLWLQCPVGMEKKWLHPVV